MSRLSPEQKLSRKREQLIARTAGALAVAPEQAAGLLSIDRRQSVRLNPLAGDTHETLGMLQAVGWEGTAYGWLEHCYDIEHGLQAVRDSSVLAEGRAYIQNAASWLPVLALDPQPGERILDVCAAPGGKTTHIAALTQNHASIIANDNSRARLAKLQANCRRMQAHVDRYYLYDARQLARKLGDRFDKILIDAPCSGEGMMQLENAKDFNSWSLAHIRRLQQLQKSILKQAWQLLKPGGVLVYSTCTMAPEENEAVVDYLLRTNSDCQIEKFTVQLPNRISPVAGWNNKKFNPEVMNCLRLKPSEYVEAFFVAKIKKLPE